MTKQQRIVLFVSILASTVAFLDGSIVNVALPAIAHEFGGGLVTQQWVINAYLVTLGSLILIAGSLSDLFGRKRILMLGIIGFGITSLLCAIAPNGTILILARALQGVAGALLVPSSLSLIISAFSGKAESKAIGTWTAWTVIAPAVGPLVGGFLVDASSWRLIFAINILPIAIILWLMKSMQPDKPLDKHVRVDIKGALLCAIGLGAVVYALIEQPQFGWSSPIIYLSLIIGTIMLGLFLWYERHASHPMLPFELFKVRNFSVGNIATAAVYAGLYVSTFLITIFIQQVGNYSATLAGLSLIPVTALMFLLSPFFGGLAGKYGPKLFMGLGPIVAAIGFITMLSVDQSVNYWTQLLPGILLFGLGLSITVAPLTSAILSSIHARQSGIGSAINNAVARIAGLIGVAGLGLIIGTNVTLGGFHQGLIFTIILLITGGLISLIGIKNPKTLRPDSE